MYILRYLFPLLLLLLVRSAEAQSLYEGRETKIFLGYIPHPITYTLKPNSGGGVPDHLITLDGLATYRPSGLHLSLQQDTVRKFAPHWAKSNFLFFDFLAYVGTKNVGTPSSKNQAGITNKTFLFREGSVFLGGIGLGSGIQYRAVFLNAGLGAYFVGAAENVYAINGRTYKGYVATLGGRIMGGVRLGSHLALEGGATYLKQPVVTPGLVAGMSWRF